jgi:hypothetical protein
MKLFKRSRGQEPGVYLIFFYTIVPPVKEVVEINLERFGKMSDMGTPLDLPVKVLDHVKWQGLPAPEGFVQNAVLDVCRKQGIEVSDPERDIRFTPGYGLGSAHELKDSGVAAVIVRGPADET